MFCSKCGASVADGVAICPACGQPAGAGAIPPQLPPVNYAGFWLRFVAYLIDIVLVSIVAIPIYLVLGSLFGLNMSSIARDPNSPMLGSAMISVLLFEGCALFGLWLYYRNSGELSLAGDGRKESTGSARDRSGWKSDFVWPRHRPIFRQAGLEFYFHDRLHHGGFHGEEAGATRHDRWMFGDEERLDFAR